jgi:Tfp pilus assembly protein PilO
MKNSSATILIIIAIGLFYTFTSSQYAVVQNLRAEAEEYQKVLDGAEAISETNASVEDQYRKIPKAEIERLNKVLPDNIDTVRLALDLDGMAGVYGISLKKVQVDRQEEDNTGVISIGNSNPYEKVNVTFTFISNYPNFTRFLADLEKSLRIANVRSIHFQTNTVGLYEHKITIETYWLK